MSKKVRLLTSKQVSELRLTYLTSETSQINLSKTFNISLKMVWNIINYKVYTDVPPPVEDYFILLEEKTYKTSKRRRNELC